jgi:hypothetical protein
MKRFCLFFLCLMVVHLVSARTLVINQIDTIVFEQLEEDGFESSELCPDEVFVRRSFLDATGTLPTPQQVLDFLESDERDKRSDLIDLLLETPEFSDYAALHWCDRLRVKAEFPSNLWPNAVQAYHRWIRDAFRNNMPYDEFVHALLTSSGSNFRDAPANFYRPFQERTPRRFLDNIMLLFAGMRLENSGWIEDELLGMDAFFAKIGFKGTAEWKEEVVYFDPQKEFFHPDSGEPVTPTLPGMGPIRLGAFEDPRIAFADWLTAPDNPWFARNAVNRIWHRLLGRGIIHEVDDVRADNPPWSEALLDYLADELVESEYDVRHVYRLIMNSATYQLSSVPTIGNRDDETGFSRYRVRRLDAEVLIDAICRITGTAEDYSSAIPEPFTFIPEDRRSIQLADGSIKSSFLEMFGRPGRDTSYVSGRNNELSTFQQLHLLNSSHILDKISKSPRLWRLVTRVRNPSDRLDQLYLEILSRLPTDDERELAEEYIRESGLNETDAVMDLAWALINSGAFFLKH